MKINKKLLKKKKKNKKKQKKVITNNIEIVSEKISFILDRADLKFIKNITCILGPKIALKLCNQTVDVEESGGINDPQFPTKRLSKLECFLHLIEHDSDISQNKKNSIQNQNNGSSTSSVSPSVEVTPCKTIRKKIRCRIKRVQNQLDRLSLNQFKNQRSHPIGNYFAIQKLNKLDDQALNSEPEFGCSNCNFIKPSKFNLSLNNGVPSITPNFADSSLLSRPKLDLNQLNFGATSNHSLMSKDKFQVNNNESVQSDLFRRNCLASNSNHFEQLNDKFTQNNLTIINSQTNNTVKKDVNIFINLNLNMNENKPKESSVTAPNLNGNSVASLFANSGENK